MIDTQKIWDEAFLAQIAEVEAKSSSNPNDWRKGGRATKANPDKEDKAWWDENGKKMLDDFIMSYKANNWKVWVTPQGIPAIELGVNVLFGDVLIKGYIDLVFENADGSLTVVDLKTGARTPDSSMQLGVYASAIENTFGIRPQYGAYYSARTGTLEPSAGIERWTYPVLTEMFRQFEAGLQAEIFLPNIGMSCGTCGVKDYCYSVGGQLAQIYDPLANITEKESK
jgi:putative RecB family exonuclease